VPKENVQTTTPKPSIEENKKTEKVKK